MSRGRKAKVNNSNLGWQQVFSKNVGKYLQYAIIELSKVENHTTETGQDLLNRIKAEKGKNKKEKELPPIKTSEIPYEIPKNWVWCRLGDICTKIGSGSTPNGSNYSEQGIPFFRSQNVQNFGLVYEDIKFINDEIHRQMNGTIVYPNDILLNITGGSLGRCALVPNDFKEGNVSQHVCIIRPVLVNVSFLHLVILSPFFQRNIFSSTTGAGREGLPKYNLEQFLIPLPPLNIQTQIVDFLTDFENENLKGDGYYFHREVEQKVIALHEAQLKGVELANELTHQLTLVKSLRQQLLQDAVQGKLVAQHPDDEPASVLLEKIKAEKEKLIAEKKIKKEKPLPPIKPEEIPFEIPEGWVWCRVNDICTKIGSGSTPKGSNYSDQGVLFFRSQNIHDGGLVYDDIKYISSEVHKQMNGTTVYANDILLNITGGSMGRCALVPKDFEEGNVSQHVCIIRPVHVDNRFYHSIILSPFFQKFIFSSTTGAGREGLPKFNLEQFPIPLPPLSEQTRIVEKLEALMQYCDGLEAGIRESIAQNERLLQQVLREALRG